MTLPFRNTYSINEEVIDYLENSKYKYPFSICQKDVTEKYMTPSDVEVELMKDPNTGRNIRLAERYAYIAMFNGFFTDWSVVDFGYIKRGKAIFHKMGRNILYIALGFNGSSLVPITEPFILQKDGSVEFIHPDTNNLRSIDVWRKYYQSTNVVEKRRRILGAQIQYADRPDFSDAVTVFMVETLLLPDKIRIEVEKPHRYWRYLSAEGTYGSVAELGFFDSDSILITGKPIGSASSTKQTRELAFDNNRLTNFETESSNSLDGAWVGLDFGKARLVNYVSIVPRGDENDIIPGDLYQLKYWSSNNNWVSLGYRTASDNLLHYDSIPSGVLLWLSDLTRGWDERPFLINEQGDVEWW